MRFHGFFRSSSAYRCRIAFNLKGIQPDTAFVSLRQNEQRSQSYLALNPQGLVPALETDEGVLFQSLAIIEWLDETQPGPKLLPSDPMVRAQVRAFAQVIACDVHPLQNLRVLKYLEATFGADQEAKDAWCHAWIAPGLETCEAMAAAQDHGGHFVFGDQPSLADICLVPQMFSADRFGLSLDPYPRLNAIRTACEALTAFAEAHPSRQSDAV